MSRKISSLAYCGVLLLGGSQALLAAPRLGLSQTAFTVPVAPGQNGAGQSVDAYNSGDGLLNLQASSSVSWLIATIGPSHACSLRGNCIPVQIGLQTASLAKGTYTGTVKVTDPNAVDAPQFITVTALIGGGVPDKLEYYLPPGGSTTTDFTTGGPVNATISNNTPWLSIAVNGSGSFLFNVPYRVTAKALTGMATGDSSGSITLSGSTFAPDNKTVPVLLHVTTLPIMQTSPTALGFQIAQGANKQTIPVAVFNGGQGTLNVATVATATTTGGGWLTAQIISGGISVTADPNGLTPATYQGTVTVTSNAANASVTLPVQLVVDSQSTPVALVGGLVNIGTYAQQEAVSQGDIVAVFGSQFTFGDPQQATTLPLPTSLGGTQVLLNGQPVPVYYVAPGQINLLIPIDATIGDGTLRVVRNGQQGNLISVSIKDRVPHFILYAGYPIMVNTANALAGIPTNPVKAGDVIVIYTIGLGPTSPVVATGTASPFSPLATVGGDSFVCFGLDTPFQPATCVKPAFVGLTPGSVGLYQINVAVPSGLPSGIIPFSFSVMGVASDLSQIAIK